MHLYNYLINVEDSCPVLSDDEYKKLTEKFRENKTVDIDDSSVTQIAIKKREYFVNYFNQQSIDKLNNV